MITVLGASGFIGSNIVSKLKEDEVEFYAPARNEFPLRKDLGHVLYVIGLTADFRRRPFDTIEAHVSKLSSILQNADFDSFTFLSSTRVYIHNDPREEVNELSPVIVNVNDPFDLFNSSKLTGESLTLNCGRKNTKIIRLSNVYGRDFNSENFITSIIKELLKTGKIKLRTTPDSAKDYIGISDTVEMILKIAMEGTQTVYNLASGRKTSNNEIIGSINKILPCPVEYESNAETILFPSVNIDRIKQEFAFDPSANLCDDMESIVKYFREFKSI